MRYEDEAQRHDECGEHEMEARVLRPSITNHVDNSAKRLEEFLGWLLSKRRQADMAGGDRTFRRRTQEFWHIWPLPPVTGEVCRVVFVDGIFLSHRVCVPIARSEEHVLGWHAARSESSSAYKALMARMAPPEVVVTMHTECPLPAAEILRVMPTDKSIAEEMGKLSYEDRAGIGARQWGDGLVWEEPHRSTPWRRDWD
ncbi:MAG: hypothetical protein ACI360_04330 [Atopobiaceae bacterium]